MSVLDNGALPAWVSNPFPEAAPVLLQLVEALHRRETFIGYPLSIVPWICGMPWSPGQPLRSLLGQDNHSLFPGILGDVPLDVGWMSFYVWSWLGGGILLMEQCPGWCDADGTPFSGAMFTAEIPYHENMETSTQRWLRMIESAKASLEAHRYKNPGSFEVENIYFVEYCQNYAYKENAPLLFEPFDPGTMPAFAYDKNFEEVVAVRTDFEAAHLLHWLGPSADKIPGFGIEWSSYRYAPHIYGLDHNADMAVHAGVRGGHEITVTITGTPLANPKVRAYSMGLWGDVNIQGYGAGTANAQIKVKLDGDTVIDFNEILLPDPTVDGHHMQPLAFDLQEFEVPTTTFTIRVEHEVFCTPPAPTIEHRPFADAGSVIVTGGIRLLLYDGETQVWILQ